jgi:hypothetical protein
MYSCRYSGDDDEVGSLASSAALTHTTTARTIPVEHPGTAQQPMADVGSLLSDNRALLAKLQRMHGKLKLARARCSELEGALSASSQRLDDNNSAASHQTLHSLGARGQLPGATGAWRGFALFNCPCTKLPRGGAGLTSALVVAILNAYATQATNGRRGAEEATQSATQMLLQSRTSRQRFKPKPIRYDSSLHCEAFYVLAGGRPMEC